MKKTKTSYLLRGTPSVLLVLGAGFVMASSKTMFEALGMSVAVILSLLLSSIVVSAIHKIIPAYAKIPAYLLIITGFVSLITMLMQAYFPEIAAGLGVHLAALSVSAVVYRDCEEVADHSSEGRSIKTALVTGAFFAVIMIVCALFRELIEAASVCGYTIEFLKKFTVDQNISKFIPYLLLALVLAAIKKIFKLNHEEHEEKEEN